MKLLRRILGLDFPDPVVGQIWRSGYNGELMLVSAVDISAEGLRTINCKRQLEPYITRVAPNCTRLESTWGMACVYAYGLDQWRRRLRSERRVLVDAERRQR